MQAGVAAHLLDPIALLIPKHKNTFDLAIIGHQKFH